MKTFYTFLAIFLISLTGFSQGYEFAVVYNSGYNFSIVAIPDFTASNTDISDIGFALMLPAGNADVTNTSQFNGRSWTTNQVDAATLTGIGLGDGSRDAFVMNLPPGQTIFSHTSGTPFVLLSFDVSNMPTSGLLEILPNTDPIATGLGGAVDSFYNSNIDATTTQNYFTGLAVGMGSFDFAILGVQQPELSDTQLSIYPNPATEVININTDLELMKVELFDILGKRVFDAGSTNQLKVDQLKSGMYFLKIHTTNGKITKKVIIE
jgi:hypothetical protein